MSHTKRRCAEKLAWNHQVHKCCSSTYYDAKICTPKKGFSHMHTGFANTLHERSPHRHKCILKKTHWLQHLSTWEYLCCSKPPGCFQNWDLDKSGGITNDTIEYFCTHNIAVSPAYIVMIITLIIVVVITIPIIIVIILIITNKCTEAIYAVALWARTLSQVWECVKYVPKQPML